MARLLAAGLVLSLLLISCALPRAQKGGEARTSLIRPGRTNTVSLRQPDNPRDASQQTVQSEQTIEYVLPPGSAIQLASPGSGASSTNLPATVCTATLPQPTPIRVVTKDRTETRIGAAQKDTVREWAWRAASLRPVLWTGIIMMTLVAGALAYFGWWTKAGVAVGVGLSMIVLAQTLPEHGTLILLTGVGVFAVAALLVLYAYYKGQLDKIIPGLLHRSEEIHPAPSEGVGKPPGTAR